MALLEASLRESAQLGGELVSLLGRRRAALAPVVHELLVHDVSLSDARPRSVGARVD
jgi:hypothetical protein